MTDLDIQLMNLEHQEDHLTRIMKRLTVGSKEYTAYAYKLINCRRELKQVKEKIKHDKS